METYFKNQRNVFIAASSSIILILSIWYFGFHQDISNAYTDIEKSQNSLETKLNKLRQMQNELIRIQNDWNQLNEEFETVIERIPNKSSFDRVSQSLYNLLKSNGLSIQSYNPSVIAIHKETVVLPETGEEIMIEKIPIDIELTGSYVNFGRFLEAMANSRYRLTSSDINISQQKSSLDQSIKFISYLYFQTATQKKRVNQTEVTKVKQPEKSKKINKQKSKPKSNLASNQSTLAKTSQKNSSKPKSNNFHKIKLRDIQICQNVINSKPVKSGNRFNSDIGLIHCFSQLDNNSGSSKEIYHIWYRENQRISKVLIRIPSGENRVAISKRNIDASEKGAWKVEIIDHDKKILDTVFFELV